MFLVVVFNVGDNCTWGMETQRVFVSDSKEQLYYDVIAGFKSYKNQKAQRDNLTDQLRKAHASKNKAQVDKLVNEITSHGFPVFKIGDIDCEDMLGWIADCGEYFEAELSKSIFYLEEWATYQIAHGR